MPKSYYNDVNFKPRIGDEVEWGLGNGTQVYSANCGRHRYIGIDADKYLMFKWVSGPINNLNRKVFMDSANQSCFEWYPKPRPMYILEEE